MKHSSLKIFAGSESQNLAANIASQLRMPLGKSKIIKFSEGNIFVEIQESVHRCEIILVQSIAKSINESFMELLFWIDAFKRNGAEKVTVIIPYFSYAKSDKPDGIGTSIRGRVCADCLEMVGSDAIITLDLHSPQIQGFFRHPVYHLSALPVFVNYLQQTLRLNPQDLVMVSPDAGFEKQARLYAEALAVPLAIGEKVRPDHFEKPIVHQITGAEVKGKIAFVVDDFTLSGGTLIEITNKLKEQGATQVIAAVSHALLSPEALRKIEESQIDQLLITDTVHNPHLEDNPKIKVLSAAKVFAQEIQEIYAL